MANFNFNKVITGGRLTAKPELKTAQSGTTYTDFNVAISRPKTQNNQNPESDFPHFKAFGKTAEFITKFFDKGDSIFLEGHIQTGSYEKNGTKVYTTDVIVDQAHFVDSKASREASAPVENTPVMSTNTSAIPSAGYIPEAYTAANAPKFEELTDSDELPF